MTRPHETSAAHRPKDLVLELLQWCPDQTLSVQILTRVGRLMGCQDNAMRVAITRLARRGLLESVQRGHYRLSRTAGPLSGYVNEWRLGERRVRPWDKRWLACHLPRRSPARARRKSLRVLELLGFREGLHRLLVRPNNLAIPMADLTAKLVALGLEPESELFTATEWRPALIGEWMTSLWDREHLSAEQERIRAEIALSHQILLDKPIEEGLREFSAVGGAAVRFMARDPLLPVEMAPPEPRRRLIEAALAYDEVGRSLWSHFLDGTQLVAMPTNLNAVLNSGGREESP